MPNYDIPFHSKIPIFSILLHIVQGNTSAGTLTTIKMRRCMVNSRKNERGSLFACSANNSVSCKFQYWPECLTAICAYSNNWLCLSTSRDCQHCCCRWPCSGCVCLVPPFPPSSVTNNTDSFYTCIFLSDTHVYRRLS